MLRCRGIAVATLSATSLVVATTTESPQILSDFPQGELRDVECERVRSSLVDWQGLRTAVQQLEDAWQADSTSLDQACSKMQFQDSDVQIVRARPEDAAHECALGTVAAMLLLLICKEGCAAAETETGRAFQGLWQPLLQGESALPVYMLGTSSWPIASLLAKWQALCAEKHEGGTVSLGLTAGSKTAACSVQEVADFSVVVGQLSNAILLPTLYSQNREADITELALGVFMQRVLPVLSMFLNGPHAEHMAEGCSGVAATVGVLLVLLRLLGPPVSRDPLHGNRLVELGAMAASLSVGELLWFTPSAFTTVLAASRHLTWRSHRLFGEIPLSEVRSTLVLGNQCLQAHNDTGPHAKGLSAVGLLETLNGHPAAQRQLWQRIATSQSLVEWWRLLTRWLLLGKAGLPSLTYLCMGFGSIEAFWLRSYLGRAIDVQLPRMIFVTPDSSYLLVCEDVRQERSAHDRLLCLRTFTAFSRHYDHNNKAKFFLFPILLSLGVDIVWLDIDIFLFKNPTARLLQQRGENPSQPKDVLVTDHFDEYCLNHGVFMVRASDRSLLWILEYIRWMHWYPYGHDQNGWDAFLGHSIVEPQMPEDLHSRPATKVAYAVLSTELEYVTLTGWAGNPWKQRERALLLHFTTTQGISGRSKKQRLLALFNATNRRPGEKTPDVRRLQMATWKVLVQLQAGAPVTKRPCYEGIHEAVGQVINSGLYEELLS